MNGPTSRKGAPASAEPNNVTPQNTEATTQSIDEVESRSEDPNVVSGRAEGRPSPEIGISHAVGLLPPAVPTIDELLAAQKDRRLMRRVLFVILTIVAMVYFLFLLHIFSNLFSKDTLPVVALLGTAHGVSMLGVAFGMVTAVGLSIMLGLVRLSSEPSPKDEKADQGFPIATALSEGLKIVAEALRRKTG